MSRHSTSLLSWSWKTNCAVLEHLPQNYSPETWLAGPGQVTGGWHCSPLQLVKYSLSDSVGFEPGAEWTWRLNYTLVSKESITFRTRQNIWDSNAALCFGFHPSELLIQAPGTCIKLTSKYFLLLQPNAGHKLYYWNFQKLLQCQRLYSVILQCWTILLRFSLDTDLSRHIPIHISLSCLQITSTFIFI